MVNITYYICIQIEGYNFYGFHNQLVMCKLFVLSKIFACINWMVGYIHELLPLASNNRNFRPYQLQPLR